MLIGTYCGFLNIVLLFPAGTLSHIVSQDDMPRSQVYQHQDWSSAVEQQPEPRSNSFDEFVKSEIAVAKAMLDESYIEKLNDAQRKRVERLMAYKNFSDQSRGQSENFKEELPKSSTNDSLSSMPNSASVAQAVELGSRSNTTVEPSVGRTKSLIPIPAKTNNKKLHGHGLQKRDINRENATNGTLIVRGIDNQQAPQKQVYVEKKVPHIATKQVHVEKETPHFAMRQSHVEKEVPHCKNRQVHKEREVPPGRVHVEREVPPVTSRQVDKEREMPYVVNRHVEGETPHLAARQVHMEREVAIQTNTEESERQPKSLVSHQTERKVKDEHHDVIKQWQAKGSGKVVEQPELVGSDMIQLSPITKGRAKENNKPSRIESANEVKLDVFVADSASTGEAAQSLSTKTVPSASSYVSRGAQAKVEPQITNQLAHEQEEPGRKAVSNTQQSSTSPGWKVLKFASKVMCSSSTSTDIHDPIQYTSVTQLQGIVKQQIRVEQIQGEEDKQHQNTTEKQSERNERRQLDTELAPMKRSSATTRLMLQREVLDEIKLLTDSALGQRDKPKLEIHSIMTQTHNLTNTAVQTEDDSDNYGSSPEHVVPGYASVHARAQGMPWSTRHAPQAAAGYSFAHAKRKKANRRKVIRVSS